MQTTKKVIASLAMTLGLVSMAHAALVTVSLDNGGVPATCQDGAVCDTNGLNGVVTFQSSLGTLTVSLGGTGAGSPALPNMNIDLAYNLTAVTGAPASTYHIMVSENGLLGVGVKWSALLGGTQTAGASTSFTAFASSTNALFALTTPVCGPVTAPAQGVSNPVTLSCSGALFPGSPPAFSLTSVVTITTPAGTSNVTGDVLLSSSIPEPGSLLLLGVGLLGAGIIRRRNAN